jgi:hypothetical protein
MIDERYYALAGCTLVAATVLTLVALLAASVRAFIDKHGEYPE